MKYIVNLLHQEMKEIKTRMFLWYSAVPALILNDCFGDTNSTGFQENTVTWENQARASWGAVLKKWRSWEVDVLLLQKNGVQFPAPMSMAHNLR